MGNNIVVAGVICIECWDNSYVILENISQLDDDENYTQPLLF